MINGSYLRTLRKERGYTLIQLSEELGCTASFLSQLERGQKAPSLSTLQKLSDTLGVPIPSFFLPEEGTIPQRSSGSYILNRRENRPSIPTSVPGVRCELLNPHPQSEGHFPVNGLYYYLPPHTAYQEGLCAQKNEGGICVGDGEVYAVFENEEIHLRRHDCLYIYAGIPHNLENRSDEPCEIYIFCN